MTFVSETLSPVSYMTLMSPTFNNMNICIVSRLSSVLNILSAELQPLQSWQKDTNPSSRAFMGECLSEGWLFDDYQTIKSRRLGGMSYNPVSA